MSEIELRLLRSGPAEGSATLTRADGDKDGDSR